VCEDRLTFQSLEGLSLPARKGARATMETLTIGRLAKATSLAARTIRYYEQVGVLPAAKRTRTGYRVYDQRDVERLLFISRARALGLPLRHLQALAETLDGPRRAIRPRLSAFVREQMAAVRRRIRDLEHLEHDLELVADRLGQSPDRVAGARCHCLHAASPSDG
jgi:DNA-binding transcriptional MerR regulator